MIPAIVESAEQAPSRDGIGVKGVVTLKVAPEHLSQLVKGGLVGLVLSSDSAPPGIEHMPPPTAQQREAGAESSDSSPDDHPSWEGDRPRTEARLHELGADLESVSGWCLSLDRPRPSQMDQAQRDALLAALDRPQYMAKYKAWARLSAPADEVKRCSSCSAPVVFMATEKGKSAPCDPPLMRVSPRGRGAVVTLVCVDGVTRKMALDPEGPHVGRISHYATCPQADQHRKPKGKP